MEKLEAIFYYLIFFSVYIFMSSVALKVARQKQVKTTENENNKNN